MSEKVDIKEKAFSPEVSLREVADAALNAAEEAIQSGSEYVEGYQVDVVQDDPTKPDSLSNKKRGKTMYLPSNKESYPRGSRTPATPDEVVAYAERLIAEAGEAEEQAVVKQADNADLLTKIDDLR